MSALSVDAAPFPAETYLTHEELCELTDEQKTAYVSFTMERFDRVAVEFVNALVDCRSRRMPVSVEALDLPMESTVEVVHVGDGLGDVVEVDVVAEPFLLPVHGHESSPVVADPEAATSGDPAMTVQEVGGSPAARAGACRCAAPAESSPDTDPEVTP